MKFSIIIPCYNESENIDNLIKQIKPLQENYDLEYILVENGSKDKSREYFKENVDGKYENIKIVYVDVNKGYGYGIQQGIKATSGDYIGWIHADLQIKPNDLGRFFDVINSSNPKDKLFLKGLRKNRSFVEKIFTTGQAIFSTLLFRMKLYDVAAVPMIFSKSLISEIGIEKLANDFSLDIQIYKEAIGRKYIEKRVVVYVRPREKGNSSWNDGLMSRFKQSKRIIVNSIKLKNNQKIY